MNNPRAAAVDEISSHLEAFVRAFVDPDRRERWREFMLEKPEKAARELHKLPLDERRTTWLEGAERSAASYERLVGGQPGICFTFNSDPVWMSATDADYRCEYEGDDVIFSVIPGKLAIYFNHDHASALLRCE
jgi:hypothetical protein